MLHCQNYIKYNTDKPYESDRYPYNKTKNKGKKDIIKKYPEPNL